MPEIPAGGWQAMIGVLFALCCTRENKIRCFAAAEKNSLCWPAFWMFYLQQHSESLWRLEIETRNYFLSLFVTQEKLRHLLARRA